MASKQHTVSADEDNGHPIAVVAARTGLSPDVLRAWERRYNAVAPARSEGNQRLYSDEDIARFRLLAAATGHGRPIGSVAALATDELERLVASDRVEATEAAQAQASTGATDRLEAALAAVLALDAGTLDRMLRRTAVQLGLSVFVEQEAPALMRRIGDEWAAGRLGVAHEHLASVTVLGILLDAIRALPPAPRAPRLLVATLAAERHGIGAALAAAVGALEGWEVVNLGVDVPAEDIAKAAVASDVRAVALSVVHDDDRAHVLKELAGVRALVPRSVRILVGGAAATSMHASLAAAGAVISADFPQFKALLARESGRPAAGVS